MSGIAAPLVFGTTYSLFVGDLAHLGLPGAPFLLGALALVSSSFVAFRATRGLAEVAAPGVTEGGSGASSAPPP